MYGVLLSRLGWCAPSCYLELLGKLQKQTCRTVGPSLAASVFSIGITLADVLQNWLNRFYFLFLEGGLLVILIDYMIFLSPFLHVTRMSMCEKFLSLHRQTLELSAYMFLILTYSLIILKHIHNKNHSLYRNTWLGK